ncbi:MAG: hypothetical protein JSS57_22090, partial [Proteobacteria bacterium]|nr:hypothetical protein [Pseudomonadota bacterium]
IPGLLRRRQPNLTADDIADVARVVAKVRNIAATMRLADLDAEDEDDAIDIAAVEAVLDDAA